MADNSLAVGSVCQDHIEDPRLEASVEIELANDKTHLRDRGGWLHEDGVACHDSWEGALEGQEEGEVPWLD